MIPATVPISAWRNARYVEEFFFDIDGVPYDLTGWSGAMQVRLYPGAAGAPLLSLANVGSGLEGVYLVELVSGIVQVWINEATLAALWTSLGGPAEAGGAIVLAYDLVMTGPGGGDEVWLQGDFNLYPGVTV